MKYPIEPTAIENPSQPKKLETETSSINSIMAIKITTINVVAKLIFIMCF